MNGFQSWVAELDSALDEEKCSAEVPQTNIASSHLALNFCLDLLIEGENLSSMFLLQTTDILIAHASCVTLNDVPEVALVLQFSHVDLSELASEGIR